MRLISSLILLIFRTIVAMRTERNYRTLRKLDDSFKLLRTMEKFAFIDEQTNEIVERYPDCIDLLTARGQAYLALDLPLYALIDAKMGSFLSFDVTSQILEFDALLSMLMIDEAREKIKQMKMTPMYIFHEIIRDLSLEEKIAHIEEELKVTFYNL